MANEQMQKPNQIFIVPDGKVRDYIDGKTTSPVTAIEATKSSTKALIEDFNKKIK